MDRVRAWSARLALALLLVAGGLAQPSPASAAEWVQNFAPVELWSGPDASAVSFGTSPQWDYFEVRASTSAGRLHVLVARTRNFAYIDAYSVGPSGPPPVGWPGSGPPATVAAPPPAAPNAPPVAPPAAEPAAPAAPGGQASLAPLPSYGIVADRALWPALQLLHNLQHTWTLQALASTATRLDWGLLPPDAAGMYQPYSALITLNVRWLRSDPRALAAVIEHEAKHVADMLAGLDVTSPQGCLTTEVNAFREEAKTWGKLVGPRGKPDPQDDLERSLNAKLALYQQNPESIQDVISRNPGYRSQCRLH